MQKTYLLSKGFSIAIFYIVLFFLVCALSIKYNIIDFDFWARYIQGKHVFLNGFPLKQDFISYTNTNTWFDPEWLTSGIFYFFAKNFSVVSLVFLKSFLIFSVFLAIIFAIKIRNKTSYPYKISYFILLLLIFHQAGILSATVRCQLVSFILVAIWIGLLEKIKQGDNKFLFLLPLIMLFWLNSHGASIAGVGILFLWGIGEYLNKNDYKKYFIVLFFVCLVFLINPWGMDFLGFMLKSAFLDRSWISEWQSSFSGNLMSGIFYKLLLFFGLSSYVYKIYKYKITYSKLNKTKLLILLTVGFLSAKYIKHIGLFVVVYSVFLFDDCTALYNDIMNKLRNYLEISKEGIKKLIHFKNIIIYLIVSIYSLYIFIGIPVKFSFLDGYFKYYPVWAVEFLKVNNIKGNILSPFYVATYCAFKLYPDNKIYMDGRQEQVYSADLFDELMFFLGNFGVSPLDAVEKTSADIILMENKFKANDLLKNNSDYTLVFSDKVFNLYLKNNITKFNYVAPTKSKEYYINTLLNTNI